MMKWRVYNDSNINKSAHYIFHTYFKTLKEAKAYAEKIGNAIIEKKIANEWFVQHTDENGKVYYA